MKTSQKYTEKAIASLKYLMLAFVFFGASCGVKPDMTGFEGKPMPAFNLVLPDGTTRLNTDKIPKGRSTVMFSFGPNCPYSRAQMKDILDNMGKFRQTSFYIFTPWPFSQMKDFITTYHLSTYPNITVGFDSANFFGDYYNAKGVPFTAIYDADKKLINAFSGKIGSRQLAAITHVK